MAKPVPADARAEIEQKVELKYTLQGVHPKLPPVYSTPSMIQLMEEACYWALQPYAEGDEITVGTFINVEHRAAVGVGAQVKAEAVMELFDGRFYTMRVAAWVVKSENGAALPEPREIGRGKIGRAFVSVSRFMEKAKAKNS